MERPDDLLGALVEHLGIGVLALDPAGRIMLWNAAAADITGYPKEVALGADALSLGIAPSDTAAAREIMARLLAGEPWEGEFPINGTPAHVRAVPVLAPDARLRAVVSAFSDATRSRRREETLALLEGLFENAPVGFTYVDTDLRYQRVNASVAEINGGSAESRIGRTIDEVHGEPCGPRFSAVCREVIRTGRPKRVRIEGRLWHGTGPHQVWRMNYYPVFDGTGEIVGVGDVFVDVTESERVRRELLELSASRDHELTRYQSLVDATSAAVWTRDALGRVSADSPSFRTITGQSVESYLAGGPGPAIHRDDRRATERSWLAAVRSGEPYQQVHRLRTTTGEYRHFRSRAAPVTVAGHVVEWIGTETDIEDEVRARTRLELLGRATAAITGEPDPEAQLQALADMLVPEFAEACSVHLIDPIVPGGRVTGRRLAHRGTPGPAMWATAGAFSFSVDHPFAELWRTAAPVLLKHPLQDGQPWARTADVARYERELGWHTTLLAPILSGGAVVAALALVAWGDRRRYTEEDVVFVSELAARASAAVEHAQRFQATRRAALTLQQAMLTRPPRRADVAIEARYQPALHELEVGGDWFDAFTLPGGDLGLVVGDVVGHDLEAAAVMGQLRSMFRGVAMDDTVTPSAAVARLDELTVALEITDFTTLLYGRLRTDADGAVFTWCSAGHVPFVVAAPGETHRSLSGVPGLVLGVDPATPRTDRSTRLPPGATLVLFTDGLVEQRHGHLDDGIAALGARIDELAGRTLVELCDEVLTASTGDTGDDAVVLAARLLPRH